MKIRNIIIINIIRGLSKMDGEECFMKFYCYRNMKSDKVIDNLK